MGWRTAFLTQARSDNEVRKLLNHSQMPYGHQLHYLQMVTEKLSKGFSTPLSASDPPAFSHSAFVSFLRAIKARPEIRRRLGYASPAAFSAFIDSMLPLAEQVERLAPNFAGSTRPNPEYPWRPAPAQEVIAPVEFDFPEFDPTSVKIVRLVDLIEKLLRAVV